MFENLFECIERHLHNACFWVGGEKVEMLIAVSVKETRIYIVKS